MILKGDSFTDPRGTLRFVNDFKFEGIRRFYTITHPDTAIFRAWQGHKIETKHFFVTKGSFLVAWVVIDNWKSPSPNLTVHQEILRAEEPRILIVPPGAANGFKALEPDSTVIVFSNLTLEESAADMYRFDQDNWKLG